MKQNPEMDTNAQGDLHTNAKTEFLVNGVKMNYLIKGN